MSLTERAKGLWANVRALAGAIPAKAAAVQAILTALAVEVVPLLPGAWHARAGGWLAVAGVWVPDGMRLTVRADSERTSDVLFSSGRDH